MWRGHMTPRGTTAAVLCHPRGPSSVSFKVHSCAWRTRQQCARRRKKTVGEPDAGNPHVRFDEGALERATA